MVNSFIEIHKPVDPHLRPWMLFVDGENLTIRAQKLVSDKAVSLQEGAEYHKNVFVGFPGLKSPIRPTRQSRCRITQLGHITIRA
jgi:hypothetical protein